MINFLLINEKDNNTPKINIYRLNIKENKTAYEEATNNLNNLFKENYSKFSNL